MTLSRTSLDFQEWLKTLKEDVKNLSQEQISTLFQELLKSCTPCQKIYLQEHLPHIFLWNPFIDLGYLPFQKILHCLDVRSLARCRQVCKEWNVAVSSSSRLWWIWCKRDGAKVGDYQSREDYFSLYAKLQHILIRMKKGTFFSWETAAAPKDLLRVVYRDGVLGVELYGRNSTTCLMDSQTYSVLQEWQSARLSCLAFRGDIIVAGSFLTGAWVWRLGDPTYQQMLQGHASAVLCADIHPSKRFVLTGSADMTVFLHGLDGGTSHMLQLGPIENHVRHVHFLPQSTSETFRICVGEQFRLIVAAVDEEGRCLASNQFCVFEGGRICSFCHATQDENLVYVSVIDSTGFCSVISYYLKEVQFTEEKLTIAGFKNSVRVLGCGTRFLIILFTSSRLAENDETHNFLIFDLIRNQILARVFVPIRSCTENTWTVSIGDTSWLHGLSLDSSCSGKFLITFVSYDGDLCCMNWNRTLWKT